MGQNLKITALSLPVMIGIVAISKLLILPDMLFWYLFSIPTHEMGHAWGAWLGGRLAVPIGAIIPMAGMTFTSLERSLFVFLAFLVLFVWLIYVSVREKTPFLTLLATAALLVQFKLTWFVGQDVWHRTFIYSGIAGEFILGTLLIISFFHRFPEKIRWDFFRYPALFAGSYAFISVVTQWWKIRRNISQMPLGSFMSGSGDSGGDLNQLIDTYGWTPKYLISHFNTLGTLCIVVIFGHYLFGVFTAWKRDQDLARSS